MKEFYSTPPQLLARVSDAAVAGSYRDIGYDNDGLLADSDADTLEGFVLTLPNSGQQSLVSVASSITLSDFDCSLSLHDDECIPGSGAHILQDVDHLPLRPLRRGSMPRKTDFIPPRPGRRTSESTCSIIPEDLPAETNAEMLDDLLNNFLQSADFVPKRPNRRQSDCSHSSIPENSKAEDSKLTPQLSARRKDMLPRVPRRRHSDMTCVSTPSNPGPCS